MGQKVWFRVKNITIEQPSQKLDRQRHGSYLIIKRIREVAYCLDLPTSFEIRSVFYVNLLRDHTPQVGEEFSEPQSLRLAIDPGVRHRGNFSLTDTNKSTKLASIVIQNRMKRR